MQVDDTVGSHFDQKPYNYWSLFRQQVTSIYTWRKYFFSHGLKWGRSDSYDGKNAKENFE